MSAPESGPGAAPEGTQCPEGQVPKLQEDGTTVCVPIEQASEKDPSATGEVTAEMGTLQRIDKLVRALFDKWEQRLDKKFDEKVAAVVKKKEMDLEEALRKSFGLEKDPVIHMSDLLKFSRKLKIETADSGKRSPASSGATGPEGNIKEIAGSEQSKAVDALLKEYEVKA